MIKSPDEITEGVDSPNIPLTHLRYHRWATERVLEECVQVPAELLVKNLKASFPSIYDHLTHLYQADSIWLDRMNGRPTGGLQDYAAPGCTWELRDAWLAVQEKMIEFGSTLDEAGWLRQIDYKLMSGAPYTSPLWQIVLHVVNHGTHHRGQVTTMLRQVGVKPVALDLIAYYRANQT